ncbi:MAG: hypothetical protein CM15mP126_7630 [Gammaproteobacteria bacterium]|nr:MAG: hypothetical protein CM15mP126_7630 [Gammaproteobacteria bacterium]
MNKEKKALLQEAYFLEYPKDIRKAVFLPLRVTGGFRTKKGIVGAPQNNICQIIGIGRPFCADPFLCKKKR